MFRQFTRHARYGLLSVADWAGIPIKKIIEQAHPTSKAQAILFNGFDDDSYLPDSPPPYKTNSWPTCSWIFTVEQLVEAGGVSRDGDERAPLPKDQVAPFAWSFPAGTAVSGRSG